MFLNENFQICKDMVHLEKNILYRTSQPNQ